MFKLKKSVKKIVGLALVGVMLMNGLQVNAASPKRTTYTYGNGKIETYDAFQGSVSLCDTEWSDVKKSVNKKLLGVIGGKDFGTQEVGPGYFQNNNNYAMYNYYCIANSSKEKVTEKSKDDCYEQIRRVHIKDLGMATSELNHFPEINDSNKWSVEVLKKSGEQQPLSMWGDATVDVVNKLKCQKCNKVVEKTGRISDTDKVFENKKEGSQIGARTDIKNYICPDCGETGNWKITSELEMHHDAMPRTAVVIVYEKNVPKKQTAKFGTINFYSYLNAKTKSRAGLGTEIGYKYDVTGLVESGKSKKVNVKKGKKVYFNNLFYAPATLKTSKSSVVSVSNKMGKAGSYLIKAKKKGTATVTATDIWGHKYTFKITVK